MNEAGGEGRGTCSNSDEMGDARVRYSQQE